MVLDRTPALDHVFHALAHPARRTMLRALAHGERTITDLGGPLRMSLPAVSKHVRVLEKARLVRRRVVGRTHICRLEAQPLKQATDWTMSYREHWERSFDALDTLLAEMQGIAPTPTPAPTRKRRHPRAK
ncbi:MAG TPA: metalloregulator ArsR/SmtB family transcription factor [Phycisphaerales bacterium]|nr:metalloregulator ArsR/SmtB family transcription factor [Phycisphaerales bacterium]